MSHVLIAETRSKSGKGVARRARLENKIPGVVYGAGKEPQPILIEGHSLLMTMQDGHFFTNMHPMKLDDKEEKVLARDIQRHPVNEKILHVDFMRFDAKQKIKVDVEVVVVGQEDSPGLLKGGVLQLVRPTVELICRADNIPHEITVSMAGKEIGDSAHISEVDLPEGAVPSVDRDFTIASVVGTRTSNMASMDAEAEAEEAEAQAEGAEDGETAKEGAAAEDTEAESKE